MNMVKNLFSLKLGGCRHLFFFLVTQGGDWGHLVRLNHAYIYKSELNFEFSYIDHTKDSSDLRT